MSYTSNSCHSDSDIFLFLSRKNTRFNLYDKTLEAEHFKFVLRKLCFKNYYEISNSKIIFFKALHIDVRLRLNFYQNKVHSL